MDTGFVTPDWSNALPSYAQDEYLPAIKKAGREAFAESASDIDQPLTCKDSVSAFAAESLFNHLEENVSPLKEHYFTVGVNSKVNNVQKQVIHPMEDEAKIQEKLTESLNSLQSSFQQLVQQIRQQQF